MTAAPLHVERADLESIRDTLSAVESYLTHLDRAHAAASLDAVTWSPITAAVIAAHDLANQILTAGVEWRVGIVETPRRADLGE